MNNKVLIDNLRCIPDFPKKGINFRDVTTLYKSAECMKIMVDELYEIYKDKGITKIVGIESRGFIMAAALAVKLGAGVVLARKPATGGTAKAAYKLVQHFHPKKVYMNFIIEITDEGLHGRDLFKGIDLTTLMTI